MFALPVHGILTVFMISPAVDEIVASGQFLVRSRRAGRPFWRTFWRGGTEPGTQDMIRPAGSLPRELASGMELNSIPWNLIVCAAVGVWLIAAPSVFGLSGHAVPNSILAGALVATFAVIGFGETSRPVHLVNVLIGLWLVASPLVLWDDTSDLRWPEAAAGIAVILFSIRRGPVEGRYGSWDRVVV